MESEITEIPKELEPNRSLIPPALFIETSCKQRRRKAETRRLRLRRRKQTSTWSKQKLPCLFSGAVKFLPLGLSGKGCSVLPSFLCVVLLLADRSDLLKIPHKALQRGPPIKHARRAYQRGASSINPACSLGPYWSP